MPRTRMTLNGEVPFTAEEEAAADAEDLLAAKEDKVADLQAAYDVANYANIDHDSKTWRADVKSQQLLAAVLSVGSVPGGMYWRDVTETQNSMTFADLQALASAILTRGLTLDSNMDTKKAAVANATTIAEVNAITW